jgi:hypothetical protein
MTTHIHNPAWPPHAKFPNAQTMSMGGVTLLHLWRLACTTRATLDAAAVTAALYWVTQISALAYPGAKAVDPPGQGFFPQKVAALPALALAGLGYAWEWRRLRRRASVP